MISNYTIITIPQWAIFAGITVWVYGWVEKKRIFGILGSGILAALGFYAAWIVFTGMLVPEEMTDAYDPFGDGQLFSPDELPVEGRLLPHYLAMVFTAVIAVMAMASEILNKRYTNKLKIIAGILSVSVFFLMMAAIRS